MIQISVTLDQLWVLANRNAEKLPTDGVAELLDEIFDGKLQSKSFTEVVFTAETGAMSQEETGKVTRRILDYLAKTFDADPETVSDKLRVTFEEVNLPQRPERDEETPEQQTPAAPGDKPEDKPRKQPEEKPAAPLSGLSAILGGGAREEETAADPEALLEKIRLRKGSRQFIAMCEDIHKLAPKYRERGLERVFRSVSYIFSIDAGCGLTSTLDLFAEYLRSEGLLKSKKALEQTIPAQGDREDVLGSFQKSISYNEDMLISIDISNWTDHLSTPEFRDFLQALQEKGKSNIYIFRVPYLEQTVLDDIAYAIADVMRVQSVAFVPLTSEELQQMAEASLAEYRYTATESAWQAFQQRVIEEKSDGRFYGVKTVDKIVDDMVSLKLRATVEGTDQDENVIDGPDVAGLSEEAPNQISAEDLMNQLVGIEAIRDKLLEIVGQIEFSRNTPGVDVPAMHMRFLGAPGTGKTTVARIVGQLMRERGILSKGYFYEHAGGDFMGMYVGHTVPKTLALCRDAYGSVLFIDEAYTLADSKYAGASYQKEALDTLIAQMENHRSDLVVIMAGYTREMDMLMQTNPGLESRMPFVLEFPNYTREQLAEIYLKMAENSRFDLEDSVPEAVRQFFGDLPDKLLEDEAFGNARYVRNIFERTWSKTVMRVQMEGGEPRTILLKDFQAAVAENQEGDSKAKGKRSRPGFRLD